MSYSGISVNGMCDRGVVSKLGLTGCVYCHSLHPDENGSLYLYCQVMRRIMKSNMGGSVCSKQTAQNIFISHIAAY